MDLEAWHQIDQKRKERRKRRRGRGRREEEVTEVSGVPTMGSDGEEETDQPTSQLVDMERREELYLPR